MDVAKRTADPVASRELLTGPARGASSWIGILAASLVLAVSCLSLPTPAQAQFGLNLGGGSFGRGGYGGRGPYGGSMARPSRQMPGGIYGGGRRPGYPGGGHGGGVRPGHPGGIYGGGRYPGYPGGIYGGGRPSGTRPPVRPPVRIVRPPVYRPPVVVARPPRWQPIRPRRPIVFARPPVPIQPVRPRRPVYVAPVAPPPSLRPPPAPPVAARPPVLPVAAPDGTYVDREVLVELSGRQPAAAIDRIARQNGLTRLAQTELTLAGTTVYRLRVNGRRGVDQVVDALSRDGRVALAQRNHLYRLTVDGGQAYYPLSASQYAATKLRLAEAHRMATGDGVTIAVIDSGVDAGHPELKDAIGASENTLSSAAEPDQHGTAIAGAIAARGQLRGVAPGSRILAIRAFAPATTRAQAQGSSWDIVRAVDLAGKAGARVVNMSFAGPQDRLMSRELAGGLQRGIVFVAAAGNAGASAPPAYPAAEPGVIAVTATDLQDKLYGSANRGAYVAVAAPGVDVLVPSPNAGYDTSTGTSVAAAHVSGIVALMLQRYGNMSPAAIRTALVSHARDLGAPGPDEEYGAGLVDAFAALGGKDEVAASPAAASPAVPATVVAGNPPPPPAPVAVSTPAPVPAGTPPPAPEMNPVSVRGDPPPAPAESMPPAVPLVQGGQPPLIRMPEPAASGAGPSASGTSAIHGTPPPAPLAGADPMPPLPPEAPPASIEPSAPEAPAVETK